MSQSRRASLFEAAAGTAIGFVVALITTALVLPMFGLPATINQSLGITAVFSVISLTRGYLVRRMFARGAAAGARGQGRFHYHVDRSGISIYRAGERVARIEMARDQLVGLAIAALRASRERTNL